MTFWGVREGLSHANRLRRSYYELLRDDLDHFMLQYGLVDSYNVFVRKQIPYPFVEMRELKPRARIPNIEYEHQNAFLLIFIEDCIPSGHKKYIRFFDVNKTTKTNLMQANTISLPLLDGYDKSQKYLESAHFYDFVRELLPVDYALLIQRDPASKARDRYALSHFHVRIDWPIAEAAEGLAQSLRYISKDLYEKGDKYAEDIQKKYFEYYGQPVMSGGRRTAAVVAAEYLKRLPCISTVYVGSSESRAVIRISERGVSRSVLVKFSKKETAAVADSGNLSVETFTENYAVAHEGADIICILQATYMFTSHARPPEDGKLRELKTDTHWLSVSRQAILPKPGCWLYPPIPTNRIYS